MRTIILFFFLNLLLALISGCTESKFNESHAVLAEKYFRSLEQDASSSSKKIFLVLNPSFCGACTEEIMDFVNSLNFGLNPVSAILSSEDSLVISKLRSIPTCKVYFSDYNNLEKHGLYGAYDMIFFLKRGKVTFSSKLSPENFEKIKSQVSEFVH